MVIANADILALLILIEQFSGDKFKTSVSQKLQDEFR